MGLIVSYGLFEGLTYNEGKIKNSYPQTLRSIISAILVSNSVAFLHKFSCLQEPPFCGFGTLEFYMIEHTSFYLIYISKNIQFRV